MSGKNIVDNDDMKDSNAFYRVEISVKKTEHEKIKANLEMIGDSSLQQGYRQAM